MQAQKTVFFYIKTREDFINFHINISGFEGVCCHSQLGSGCAKSPQTVREWLCGCAPPDLGYGHWHMNSYKCLPSWNCTLLLILVNHWELKKKSQPAKSNRWLLVYSLPLPDLDGCGTSVRSSGKRSASKLILQVGETQGRGDPRVSSGNRWSLRFPRSNQIHSLPVVSSSTFE